MAVDKIIARTDPFINATVIPNNTNLNNLETPGVYYISSASSAQTLTNCPAEVAFTMLVMKKAESVGNQIIFAVGIGSGNIFARTKTTNGWQAWSKANLTAV